VTSFPVKARAIQERLRLGSPRGTGSRREHSSAEAGAEFLQSAEDGAANLYFKSSAPREDRRSLRCCDSRGTVKPVDRPCCFPTQ